MESTVTEIVSENSHLRANPIEQDPISKSIQNALILDELSKYICIFDMKNFRSVNNLWKNEWTPLIQKRSKFQLCITNKLDMLVKDLHISLKVSPTPERNKIARSYFCTMEEYEINTRASSLIQWISESIHNFPCSKISIGTQAFNIVDQSVQEDFFCAISSIVTELCLTNNCEHLVFPFSNLENLHLEFCNLKTLEIQMRNFVNKQLIMTPKSVVKLIQLATNLDTLKLSGPTGYARFFTGCINSIGNPKQIKTLHIDGSITGGLLKTLAEKNLALNEFGVRFNVLSSFSCKSFKSFLKSQTTSLKRLSLRASKAFLKCETLCMSMVVVPLMSNLEKLELNLDLNFPEIALKQSSPKLKHLKITCENALQVFVLNEEPFQTLEGLDLRTMQATQTHVLQACEIFPNVKRLAIPCTKAIVVALNEKAMKNLEEVTLYCNLEYTIDDLNEVLTGYSKTELEAADQEGLLVETERRPLSFFQKVKVLRLEKAVLTDLVCSLGPMRLSSLQCLDLRIPNLKTKHQISETILEAMRTKFTVLL